MKRLSGCALKEFIQEAIKSDLLFVYYRPVIESEEWHYPFFAEIIFNTPASQRQVLMTVGKPQSSTVYEAREIAISGHEIG